MGQKNGDLLDEMVGQPLYTIGFPRKKRLWFSYGEVYFAEAKRFYISSKNIHRDPRPCPPSGAILGVPLRWADAGNSLFHFLIAASHAPVFVAA